MNLYTDFFFPDISVLYRKFQTYISSEIAIYDISGSEFPCLLVLLFIEDGILQDDLVKRTKLAKSIITRSLQSLEQKDFVYRKESAHSSRFKLVFATEKAHALKPKLRDILFAWEDFLKEDINIKDIETTLRTLKLFTEKVNNKDFTR